MSIRAIFSPASFGWVCLQLQYDGRHPPMALLDDLARLGWSVPPPPSRPASAIDWYTPDPETGQRFTVRPWQAIHDIEAPGRHRHQGTWPAEARAGALRAAGSVLADHGVDVTSPAPDLVALATGPAPGRNGPRGSLPPPPRSPAPPAAAGGPVVIAFAAPVERRERIEALLRSTGLAYRTATESRLRQQRFRGSVVEQAVLVLVGDIVVTEDQVEDLRDRLRDEQATMEVRPATHADLVRPPPEPPPVPTELPVRRPDDGGGATAETAATCLRVALNRGSGAVVDRLIGHPALEGLAVTVMPTVRPVRTRYRGAETEVSQPVLDVEVSCPPGRVTVVLAALARETGVPEEQIIVRGPDGDGSRPPPGTGS